MDPEQCFRANRQIIISIASIDHAEPYFNGKIVDVYKRQVNTVDAMTATIEPIDWSILMKITDRILQEVKNVNRVCYDLSPKPNATIRCV